MRLKDTTFHRNKLNTITRWDTHYNEPAGLLISLRDAFIGLAFIAVMFVVLIVCG